MKYLRIYTHLHLRVRHPVLLEKLRRVAITAHPHDIQLLLRPLIQVTRSHKRYMDAHSTVHGAAVKTEKYSVRCRRPRRISRRAIKAYLVLLLGTDALQHRILL